MKIKLQSGARQIICLALMHFPDRETVTSPGARKGVSEMKKTNVIVRATGEVVCECEGNHEAMMCLVELIRIDKADGTYEKGFYQVVEGR